MGATMGEVGWMLDAGCERFDGSAPAQSGHRLGERGINNAGEVREDAI